MKVTAFKFKYPAKTEIINSNISEQSSELTYVFHKDLRNNLDCYVTI
jgi:hypothetical protein